MKSKISGLIYWILAIIGVQVLIGVGLALCFGEASPAHLSSNAVERRLYSAVDVGAAFVAISAPALLASIVTYLAALRWPKSTISIWVLGLAWPAFPLVLFMLSLNTPLLYLAVLQSLAGILVTKIGNASDAFGPRRPPG
ncbi:hypothetical protein ACFVWG_25610 [Kribbella sp. NPDC058245]|uniref:hypothetical protein n=1 Tax=Kribbella sp. NPDC058245 TaxID=3346399 RepID=UPI0036E6C6BF